MVLKMSGQYNVFNICNESVNVSVNVKNLKNCTGVQQDRLIQSL